MKTLTQIMKRGLGVVVLTLSLVTAACDDAVTGPDLGSTEAVAFQGPSNNLTTSTGENVLTWSQPLTETVTVTERIGKRGGKLGIEGLIYLEVPKGALSKRTELSMTALAGEDVAFKFGPHGTHFNKPVSIWVDLCAIEGFRTATGKSSAQDTGDCELWWKDLQGDETGPQLDVDGLVSVYFTNSGPVVETLDIIDVELQMGRYLVFKTDHFSGYALAW
ncbi:MAG: hypothetical protein ACR2QM_00690 [Longimicrobiales bacterium]